MIDPLRTWTGPCEFRMLPPPADKPERRTLRGYAAVFNSDSADLGGFKERVLPGAFREALQRDDVRALINHNPTHVLGRNTARTLRLEEDGNGLAFEVDLPDTSYARDLLVSLERRDLDQASFQFRSLGDRWERIDGVRYRMLSAVKLIDVSVVTFPAYGATSVSLRSENRDGPDETAERLRRFELTRRRLKLWELA